MDDIIGCRRPAVQEKVRAYHIRRFGTMELPETNFTHVGAAILGKRTSGKNRGGNLYGRNSVDANSEGRVEPEEAHGGSE